MHRKRRKLRSANPHPTPTPDPTPDPYPDPDPDPNPHPHPHPPQGPSGRDALVRDHAHQSAAAQPLRERQQTYMNHDHSGFPFPPDLFL